MNDFKLETFFFSCPSDSADVKKPVRGVNHAAFSTLRAYFL